MALLKPFYGEKTQITISLNSLANGSIATSDAIDNSNTKYQDFLIEIKITGTAGSTAWLDVRLLCSEDGTNFGTWESAIPLGTIDLSISPQVAHFSLLNALFQAPKYFKIAVKNNTGNALSSSNNSASYQGLNVEIV